MLGTNDVLSIYSNISMQKIEGEGGFCQRAEN